MTSITTIMTCYNRKNLTKACIESLDDVNLFNTYVITDDGSTDGTHEMLVELAKTKSLHMVQGSGQLYWAGGMRQSIEVAIELPRTDYYLLVNDDVNFCKGAIKGAIQDSIAKQNAVIVGATKNKNGEMSYGGVNYRKGFCSIQYDKVGLSEACMTFNCNFVLLPKRIFMECKNFDVAYTHAMADFDYGLQMYKKGFPIYVSSTYVGTCENNSKKGTWNDRNLSIRERLTKKESPKGLPAREWFYYLKKNFGIGTAVVRSITPYMKILLRR